VETVTVLAISIVNSVTTQNSNGFTALSASIELFLSSPNPAFALFRVNMKARRSRTMKIKMINDEPVMQATKIFISK